MTITAKDILGVTKAVTKEWTKQRKAEDRGRRSLSSREYMYSSRVNFSDVARAILPGAHAHASGDGQYTVSRRQLYYACREKFRQQTGREIEYAYFSGTLLVQYMNRHPETDSWKVTADARGTLTIPNAGYEVRVPCGTIQIDDHLREVGRQVEPFDIDTGLKVEWPSLAAGQRYQAVVYIEKEGFAPLLEEAQIAERFEVAILSCKGQSVVAARRFVDEVCYVGGGVPLFVVHDFDKAGFEISERLTTVSDWAEECDRVTYRFKNDIDVTDLGLRLFDVEDYGLQSEACDFKGGFADDSIAIPKEQEFLRSGRRVELNAFTSPEFIKWLEVKLTLNLFDDGMPAKLSPLIPADDVLTNAYRRALAVAKINSVIQGALKDAIRNAKVATVPKALRQKLINKMKKTPGTTWDDEIYRLAESAVERMKE